MGGGASLSKSLKSLRNNETIKRRVEEKNSSISSFSSGFTLVELLAVITILAVILLIAVPQILGVIEDTKKGAFGGYTSGTNKSMSVACYNGLKGQYSGWRVLSKTGSGASGTVTLIHAGVPECYYHASGFSDESVEKLNVHANSQYVNDIYAQSARSVTCDDLKTYDSNACVNCQTTIDNDLIKTGSWYWLDIKYDNNLIWHVNNNSNVCRGNYNYAFGFRPVVLLKVKILKTDGLGTTTIPYEISIES